MAISADMLPIELYLEIITIAMDVHPIPGDILCVNRTFYALALPILHYHLRFPSSRHLVKFSMCRRAGLTPHQPAAPELLVKSITLDTAGGEVDFGLFTSLKSVIRICMPRQSSFLHLDSLTLRINSHVLANPRTVYDALSLANPTRFSWNGPDPAHHFSIAIVPPVTTYLFRAIASWSHLTHLTLANMALDPRAQFQLPLDPEIPFSSGGFMRLPASLEYLYIGQTTALHTDSLAQLLLSASPSLVRVDICDAYAESIWGRRIRRPDVEQAAMALGGRTAVKRVAEMLRCFKLNDRIIGGDRDEVDDSMAT